MLTLSEGTFFLCTYRERENPLRYHKLPQQTSLEMLFDPREEIPLVAGSSFSQDSFSNATEESLGQRIHPSGRGALPVARQQYIRMSISRKLISNLHIGTAGPYCRCAKFVYRCV